MHSPDFQELNTWGLAHLLQGAVTLAHKADEESYKQS